MQLVSQFVFLMVITNRHVFLLRHFIGSRCHFPLFQPTLESRAMLMSNRTIHVQIGCHFSFQFPHSPRCNFNASKSLPATSLLVSSNRLWSALRIKSLICRHRHILRQRFQASCLQWRKHVPKNCALRFPNYCIGAFDYTPATKTCKTSRNMFSLSNRFNQCSNTA